MHIIGLTDPRLVIVNSESDSVLNHKIIKYTLSLSFPCMYYTDIKHKIYTIRFTTLTTLTHSLSPVHFSPVVFFPPPNHFFFSLSLSEVDPFLSLTEAFLVGGGGLSS